MRYGRGKLGALLAALVATALLAAVVVWSGDRVRVQLLHCEPWHGMGFHPVVIEPRMTNRVEFTVP